LKKTLTSSEEERSGVGLSRIMSSTPRQRYRAQSPTSHARSRFCVLSKKRQGHYGNEHAHPRE
jgi:hypothetical protein